MNYLNEQILDMTEGLFFGEGNAQLPNDLMLMIDEMDVITKEGGNYNKGYIQASLNIKPDHWFFACHFKSDPVMPGCLGLDALWQLLGVYLGFSGLKGRGRALGVGGVKFTGQIYPNAKQIVYQIHIKRVFSKPMSMGIAEGFVLLNDKVIYQANDLKVGLIK
ncbi:bifunctional 3-hydroxydecanoyl-ACP dehydratase/trans-2-decenoyl-ACP isomerase [Marinicellulosiphila megalodicopiae]|uniref:bifunctional 3-hydroxydecanoyl-ACP dehydratase/trans-2-decenoyl-ACP isomerase n=1 Tax=Marinicellulosiphila megalodicopiae TaxID=2724896 RepID=UPI003BB1127F